MVNMLFSGTQRAIEHPEEKRSLCPNGHRPDGRDTHKPFGPNGRHIEICADCGRALVPKEVGK